MRVFQGYGVACIMASVLGKAGWRAFKKFTVFVKNSLRSAHGGCTFFNIQKLHIYFIFYN